MKTFTLLLGNTQILGNIQPIRAPDLCDYQMGF